MTKFLLLNSYTGWQAEATNVLVGDQMQLRPLPGNPHPLTDADGSFGGLVLPNSMALDTDGRLYTLDAAAHKICCFDPCDNQFHRLPTLGGKGHKPRQFLQPTAIAISRRNDLFVVDSGNRRVQQVALKGLVLRAIWGPLVVTYENGRPCVTRIAPTAAYPANTWQPVDAAITRRHWVYISDRANGLIHLFDAHGRWRTAYDGVDDTGQPLVQPTHLALDNAGRIYVVQEGQPDVVVLDENGRFLRRLTQPADARPDFAPIALAFDPAGQLYACDGVTGRLYLYDDAQTAAIRCHAFKGQGCAMTVDPQGHPFIADARTGQILRLESSITYVEEGQVLIGPLDSEIYRCPWHRVAIDGRVELGTAVHVHTFTADTPRTAYEVGLLPENRWETGQVRSHPADGEWDCLIRSAPARYLWLRLTLRGDQRHTPTIRRLRLDYPRATSLRHLPAVFREDPTSADFLDRFLSIFDDISDDIGQVIGRMAALFDPDATPVEFLDWLAGWLGLALDHGWPVAKRRRLLREAHRLYALRGTPEGLRLHVALYADAEPHILEHFKLRRWLFLNQGRLGDSAVLWGADVINRLQLNVHAQIGRFQLIDSGDPLRDPFHAYAHQFSIFVPQRCGSDGDAQQRALARIVELAKPAHTLACIELVQPRMRIGVQSFVGINTVIGQYPAGVTTGQGALGYDTLLGPSANESAPPTMQVGHRARIGSSTRLD